MSLNKFENLLFIEARTFESLKERLMDIKFPASIIRIDQKATGQFYAFLQADRPVKQVQKKSKE